MTSETDFRLQRKLCFVGAWKLWLDASQKRWTFRPCGNDRIEEVMRSFSWESAEIRRLQELPDFSLPSNSFFRLTELELQAEDLEDIKKIRMRNDGRHVGCGNRWICCPYYKEKTETERSPLLPGVVRYPHSFSSSNYTDAISTYILQKLTWKESVVFS